MERPMFLTSVLFCLSIIVYSFFGIKAFIISVSLCVVIAGIIDEKALHIILYFLLFIGLFFSVLKVNEKTTISYKNSGEDYVLDLIVCSDEIKDDSNCVAVKVYNNDTFIDGTKFNLYFRNTDLECGERIKAKVKLFEIDNDELFNIGRSKDTYGNLWLNGIIKRNGSEKSYRLIGDIREIVKENIGNNLSPKSGATLNAIMLGDKSFLSDSYAKEVKNAGVSHIMAVSGLHLSVIMMAMFLIVNRIVKNKFLRFVCIVIAVVFLCALCGFTPSIMRAGAMFILFAVPPLVNRDSDRLAVLCLAVTMLLIISPMIIFNVSFQMSVSAIIAVMIISPCFLNPIKEKHCNSLIGVGIIDIIIVSVLAQIFTMPFAIYYFGKVSVVSPITNLFISLPTTSVLQLGFFGIISSFIPIISKYLFFMCENGIRFVNYVITYFGSKEYSAITVQKEFCFIPVILIVGISILARFTKKRSLGYERN